jgi:hypothetical protein
MIFTSLILIPYAGLDLARKTFLPLYFFLGGVFRLGAVFLPATGRFWVKIFDITSRFFISSS